MLNKIYLWIGLATAALLALLGIKSKAKSDGKQEAKQEQAQEIQKNVQKAKRVQDSVARLPDADVRDKLRKRAARE